MDHTDNELQGTNSSGSLGGLDVRRRIPIKLISKQGNKAKTAPRTPRTINRMPAKAPPGDEEGFDYNEEERYDCKGGELFGNQRRFPGHLFWDFQINILGEKDDTPVHFCDKCGLPIKIYGRMVAQYHHRGLIRRRQDSRDREAALVVLHCWCDDGGAALSQGM